MLTIVPARGISKGLPGKNIRMLSGVPLIGYTFEAARKAKHVSKIILSTDDDEIASVARGYGIEIPFMRPPELATDSALAIDNYIYTVERLNREFGANISEFAVLQPTSPLRTAADIDNAIELFRDKDAESVISFCASSHPPLWAKKITDGKVGDYFNIAVGTKSRREFDAAYFPNGAIFVFKLSLLKERHTYYSERTYPYIMPPERSLDIDTEESFEFAEFLLAKKYAEVTDRNRIARFLVREGVSIRSAFKVLDGSQIGFIGIVDGKDQVVGVVTYREFRNAILSCINLEKPIGDIANRQYKYLEENFTEKDVLRCFQDPSVENIPILSNGKLKEVVTRTSDIQDRATISNMRNLIAPVVIMAGGKGTRLDPFTRILPKPLIPINEKPLIEIIMDEFARYGAQDFYISINHKAKIIKAYFEESPSDYNISYLEESKPLGTAGVLRYMLKKTDKAFFVSNCDIIVRADYSEIYDFHCQGGYDLTVVASLQHHIVPYGVCTIENGGGLRGIEEKPQYDLLVNTGMYVLNPSVLSFIPENQFYHITHLISELKTRGGKIGVYPVSEQAWFDVGQWAEYRKNLKLIVPDIRN